VLISLWAIQPVGGYNSRVCDTWPVRHQAYGYVTFSAEEHCLLAGPPLPSNRHHRSSGDCLEGKGENYQAGSVQYCAQQLCTVRCTHI